MIFVTVGTHEQQFNRLLRCIDKMAEDKEIDEDIVVQKGFSNYELKYCKSYEFIEYDKMQRYIQEARIIITHGGPSSFIMPLSIGKIPIVVPRKKEYNEHVNNHQVDFSKTVEKRMKNIIIAETEEQIIDSVLNYEEKIKKMSNNIFSNNKKFVEKLEYEIEKMFS